MAAPSKKQTCFLEGAAPLRSKGTRGLLRTPPSRIFHGLPPFALAIWTYSDVWISDFSCNFHPLHPSLSTDLQAIRLRFRLRSTISKRTVLSQALRAQRLKKINLAWNFQSHLKISISLNIFNPDLQNSPQKQGFCGWRAWNFQSRLKFFKILNFSVFGPLSLRELNRSCNCDFEKERHIDSWPWCSWKAPRHTSRFYRDTFATVYLRLG